MDLGIVSGGASRQVAPTSTTETRHPLVPADTAASTTSASVRAPSPCSQSPAAYPDP